jgi:sulfite reductase beta subunit-like hemoprotein
MNKDNTDRERVEQEQEILIYSVSDAALESAAWIIKEVGGAVTLSFCSGVDTCPS